MKKILLGLLVSLSILSCESDSREENLSQESAVINKNVLSKTDPATEIELFTKSVAIIKFNYGQTPSESVPLTVRMISYDENYELLPVYKYDGVEYSDNGLFNDAVAGDGIYTSVENLKLAQEDIYNGVEVNIGEDFLHKDKLVTQVKTEYAAKVKPGGSIKFGCKMKLGKCPNTSWYNTSYFGEPCVFFYDCEASFEIGIDF